MRAIIFDMDGTLSSPEGRLHHLDGEKDWKAFHDGMGDDPPIEAIVALARIAAAARAGGEAIAVLVVTARHDDPRYEAMTREWLELHEVPYDRLYMRADADTRPDVMVKRDILQRILDDGYEPILAVDDRRGIVDMWRDHGIVTLHCAPEDAGASVHAGRELLTMLVGPCGAGKSTYAAKTWPAHEIISTDELRLQMFDRMDHSPEALAKTWRLAHGMIRARLDAGCHVVLDATNIKAEDRAKVLALLPRGVFCRYVVIDRDLGEKIAMRGERTEDMVIAQHRLWRKEERAIMAGDDHPWVRVQDRRTR